MFSPEDQLKQALERIKRFQTEAEKHSRAQAAGKEKVRNIYTFRKRFGFTLVRWGLRLAGKMGDF